MEGSALVLANSEGGGKIERRNLPEESEDTIPYSGICEHTKKIKRVIAVHPT